MKLSIFLFKIIFIFECISCLYLFSIFTLALFSVTVFTLMKSILLQNFTFKGATLKPFINSLNASKIQNIIYHA